MGFWDWFVSLALVLLVIRQIRGRRLGVVGLLWPIGLVGWAGWQYLGALPPERPDRTFVAVLGAVGLALGVGCGLLTAVHVRETVVMARATGTAAALWVIGMASRLAFGVTALHGGAPTIARLSSRLDLHASTTWATALVVMALAEVVARTAVLSVKHHQVSVSAARATPREHVQID